MALRDSIEEMNQAIEMELEDQIEKLYAYDQAYDELKSLLKERVAQISGLVDSLKTELLVFQS